MAKVDRGEEGRKIWEEQRDKIFYDAFSDVWWVPSRRRCGNAHGVDLRDLHNPHCSCPDNQINENVCAHIHAAMLEELMLLRRVKGVMGERAERVDRAGNSFQGN